MNSPRMSLDDVGDLGFKVVRSTLMIGLYVASMVASRSGEFQQALILFGVGVVLAGQAIDGRRHP